VIKVYLGTLSINRDDGDGTTSGRPRRRSLHPQLESRPVNAAQRLREALADKRRRGARFEAIEDEGRLTVIDKLACTPHVDGRSR
jgi:hypothetical protein